MAPRLGAFPMRRDARCRKWRQRLSLWGSRPFQDSHPFLDRHPFLDATLSWTAASTYPRTTPATLPPHLPRYLGRLEALFFAKEFEAFAKELQPGFLQFGAAHIHNGSSELSEAASSFLLKIVFGH